MNQFATLLMLTLFSVTTGADNLLLDWDSVTWDPPGITNLSETYNVGGRDIVVTYSGNTAGLDQEGPVLSPQLDSTNTGGLNPVELSLVIGTDYLDPTDPEVSVTFDFSDYKGGVSNISFAIFDVDEFQSFIDEVEITAETDAGTVDPTSLVTSPFNIATSSNTVIGTLGVGAPPTSELGSVFVEFAQTGITQLTIVYRNPAQVPDPGFQWINVHDISFERQLADISVTKDVDNATPGAGDNVVYTITVANDGPDTGTGLELTDQLPAGLTYVSDDSGGSYDSGTGIWDIGSLAPGASQTLLITATVNATGPYDNIAELTAADTDDLDSEPGNNDPTEDDQDNAIITPAISSADLSLLKTVDVTEPMFGDTITFTITVTNDGPGATTGVSVEEILPSGFAYDSDTPSTGTYDVNTGLWTIGAMAAGAVETLQIAAVVLPSGDYTNIAQIESSDIDDPDSDPGNDDPDEDDQDMVGVTPLSIGIAKSVSTGPVNNGDGTFSLTYTLFVQNYGAADLDNLQVVDDLAATYAGATGFVVDSVTSGDFAVNPAFDGSGDTNLLAGTDTLVIDQSGTIDVAVTVTPGANLGPYDNVATATGTGPGGTPATDDSEQGVDPDPDGDGDPGNNNTPTPVLFSEAPVIGLAKQIIDGPNSNGDGTSTLTFNFVIDNLGDVPLSDLQLIDDLSTTFAGVTGFTIDNIASTDFAVNNSYDGDGDINLLAGTDTLAIGASGQVSLTVTVEPGPSLGPFNNTATATALSPTGTPVSDDSTDGALTDPDGDGDPSNNNDPTPIPFAENPQIGTFKQVSAGPINNGDGSYDVTYLIGVENFGDVPLNQIQIMDDLATTFATASSFTVLGMSSSDFDVNSNFNGSSDINMLLGTDTLAVGASGSVELQVRIVPGGDTGPYNNTAVGSGVSPAGTPVQDDSTDGIDADPDGDDDPTNNNVPTPVSFPEDPGIGIAKGIPAEPVSNNNGTFTLTYVLTVENFGDVPINNVQVVDDLAATYADAVAFVVNSVQSADFTVNGAYDGVGDTNLLSGTDTLAVGTTSTIDVIVTVTPGGNGGPYLNTAVATGTSPGGDPVQDTSTDGLDPDPDNDGDPGNNDDPTPITFALPEIVVTKSAEPRQTTVGGLVRYTVTVENTGNAAVFDLTLQDLIPAGFAYADGSANLDGDGTLTVSGQRPIDFGGINLNPGDVATLTYILRVGAGVIQGDYTNVVGSQLQGDPIGNTATATVTVIADPDFEDSTIIGRVFDDDNENGIPDEGEKGIPGVRLGTVEGLIIETDSSGRYHIAGVDGGRPDRGRNFIVKVDPATLPEGSVFTTENPRVKRITQGLLSRFDFGINVPNGEQPQLARVKVKLAEVFFLPHSDQVDPKFYPALQEFADLLKKHGGGTLFIEGNTEPCARRGEDKVFSDAQTLSYNFTPRFGIRKAILTDQDRANLDRELASWRDARDVSILSIGHTSSVRIAPQNRHEFADNYELSRARAKAVADYVQSSLGLDTSSIETVGRGPDQPVDSNETTEGRAANRRVELILSGQRVIERIEPGAMVVCDTDLSERRAQRVYETLEPMIGKDLINSVEVLSRPPQ